MSSRAFRQGAERFQTAFQLGIPVGGKVQGPAAVKGCVGPIGPSLYPDLGPQVFVPQHGGQHQHAAVKGVAVFQEIAAGQYILHLPRGHDSFVLFRYRNRSGFFVGHVAFRQCSCKIQGHLPHRFPVRLVATVA